MSEIGVDSKKDSGKLSFEWDFFVSMGLQVLRNTPLLEELEVDGEFTKDKISDYSSNDDDIESDDDSADDERPSKRAKYDSKIEDKTLIMLPFLKKLTLKCPSYDFFEHLNCENLEHLKINISDHDEESHDHVMEFLNRIKKLKYLELKIFYLDSIQGKSHNILQKTPFLEELTIDGKTERRTMESITQNCVSQTRVETPLMLPFMNKLTFNGPHNNFLENLNCENLYHLIFNSGRGNDHIVEFLNRLKNLKLLELNGNFIESEVKLMPRFKLESINLSVDFGILFSKRLHKQTKISSNHEFYKNLMESAAKGAELCFKDPEKSGEEFVIEILKFLAECENIEKLTIDFGEVPKPLQRSYKSIPSIQIFPKVRNITIDSLKIVEIGTIKELTCLGDISGNELVLLKFTRLEKLTLNSFGNIHTSKYEFFCNVGQKFTKLKQIKAAVPKIKGQPQHHIERQYLGILEDIFPCAEEIIVKNLFTKKTVRYIKSVNYCLTQIN